MIDPTRLAEIVHAARAEWPDANVDPGAFVRLVEERLDPALPVAQALEALRLPELYIVCGCAAGDPKSITAFERKYFVEIKSAVRRVASPNLSEDDVAQLVREKLFVAAEGARPKILDYRGTGSLRAWLRVTASRLALNLATRGPKEKPTEDEWFARVVVDADHPEIAQLKVRYRAEFRSAMQEAVRALEPKDRNVLRYAFGDGRSIDQIGAIYGVHRATAARWITAAQASLVEKTREMMMHRLGANQDDIQSIIQLIASKFDVSFAGMLGKSDSD